MLITQTGRLKVIQRRLGVDDDGILGPDTLTRIESVIDKVLKPLETEPEYSLIVSREGLNQIVQFEISSESYYKRRLSRPIWPMGDSGFTIGIGYDLGYDTKTRIKKRLWNKSELRGLHTRRDKEAQMIVNARTDYHSSELVLI